MEYKLYQGDCLPILRAMPTGGIDLLIADPPYGIGENNDKNLSRVNLHSDAKPKDYGAFEWDAERLSPEYIAEFRRVSKNQIIFGGNYYADLLPPSPSWIVWDKNNTGDFADCELAWTSHKRAVRKVKYTWNGFIKAQPEERYHPTQKPLNVLLWCLREYAKPGYKIFDPCFGAGTTAVACKMLGYDFAGCELDPRYIPIAEMRLAAAQPLLPYPAE